MLQRSRIAEIEHAAAYTCGPAFPFLTQLVLCLLPFSKSSSSFRSISNTTLDPERMLRIMESENLIAYNVYLGKILYMNFFFSVLVNSSSIVVSLDKACIS